MSHMKNIFLVCIFISFVACYKFVIHINNMFHMQAWEEVKIGNYNLYINKLKVPNYYIMCSLCVCCMFVYIFKH